MDQSEYQRNYFRQRYANDLEYRAHQHEYSKLWRRDRYVNDPDFDIHAHASELTGGAITRQDGKVFNFMKIYSGGV